MLRKIKENNKRNYYMNLIINKLTIEISKEKIHWCKLIYIELNSHSEKKLLSVFIVYNS